jgi:hypothetical protein
MEIVLEQQVFVRPPADDEVARPHTQKGPSPFHRASTLSNSLECWTTLSSRAASLIPILTVR